MVDERKEQSSVRSFRVTDSVMGRFKELQDEMGLTQDGALKMLVEAYELEKAKNAIPDRETEIANFQTKASELVAAFLHSLQLNQDAEERIRSEVALQLQSKDRAIEDYQGQLKEAKEKIADLMACKDALKAAEEEASTLRISLSAKDFEIRTIQQQHAGQISDKDNIITMLQKDLVGAQEKAESFDLLKAQRETLADNLRSTQDDLRAAQEAHKDLQRDFELQAERAARAAEKAQEKAVAAIREEMQQIQLNHERELREIERSHDEERRTLEQENSRLREQLATLQAKGKGEKQ